MLNAVENQLYEVVDAVLVFGVHLLCVAVGDDHTARHSTMSEQSRKAGKSGRFHLEVADLQLAFACLIAEGLNLLVLTWVLNLQTNLTTLRPIEAAAGNRDAAKHFLPCDLLDERGVGTGNVRCAFLRTPVHVLRECLFQLEVADVVTSCVVVEQAVEADALHAGDERSQRSFWLKAATSADADNRECAMPGLVVTLLEVDVGERVKLVHHDVDVVATDARAEDRNAFALVGACDGVELAALNLAFLRLEVCGNGRYSPRVAHKDDAVGQLFGLDVKMKDAAIFIDDEFG